MLRYSSDSNIYPEEAPYQPSRSALRRRFGNRAIVSYGPAKDSGRPGSASAIRLGEKKGEKAGFTEEATWRAFFGPKPGTQPVAHGPAINYSGQPIKGTNYAGDAVTLGGVSSQPTAAAPMRATAPESSATFYDETSLFGRSTPGVIRSGTNFVTKFGYGGVRSAADVKAGRNELTPQKGAELMAWDKFLKSPAPVSQPATSMNLLPEPRSGSPMVAPSRSDYAPTPTADDYYGSIIGNPSKLSITTGVLGRLGKASTWDEPI